VKEDEMGRACNTNGDKGNAYRILLLFILTADEFSPGGSGTTIRHNTQTRHDILMGKPEGKRPVEKRRRRWVDNTKIGLREIGWHDMYWIDLAQDRDKWKVSVNMVMNLRVPKNAGKFLSSCCWFGLNFYTQTGGSFSETSVKSHRVTKGDILDDSTVLG
jgi:hypothetical protein